MKGEESVELVLCRFSLWYNTKKMWSCSRCENEGGKGLIELVLYGCEFCARV